MTKLTTLAAALAATAFMAGNVHAQEQHTMRVYIGDLNVQSEQGAKQALRRIRSEASDFCGPQDPTLRSYQGYKTCTREMTAKAVAQLDAPRVSALYKPSQPIQLADSGTPAR